MAYTTPPAKWIKPPKGPRYIHRRVYTVPVGSNGSAAATAQVKIPCPGRLVAIKTVSASTQAGTLTIKADTTDGVQIWTDGDISSDVALSPVGTTAQDEGAAATAATDGFSGGLPVRAGVFLTYASANAVGHTVDLFFRLCEYIRLELVAQTGADGTGAVTRTVKLGHAGVLAAIAIDYQNTPATADLVIKADDSSGSTLYTRANSQTDVGPQCLGRPGVDEAINASAATDGTECGNAFRTGLYFDLAQTDIFTSSNEKTIVECWIDS